MALPATEREETAGLVDEMAAVGSISRPPSTLDVFVDRVFRGSDACLRGAHHRPGAVYRPGNRRQGRSRHAKVWPEFYDLDHLGR